VIDNAHQLVPADPAVIATRLTATMTNGLVRRSLAAHGRKLVGERFTWDGVCAAYRKLLIDLAEGP
jgi:glycosyltransferase involved in cell wall biosynthesis